ncbi:leucyl/phenylalanyl-tRNA--protein transferase [Phycisphaera mikurensis]|uniref:Leucyl/phenylalanyl-tRNA--protein transferase n=1 Tax=Phycisphaera mikurensis (strain NBRC 102666 / KCTC 22515 / FYK2301M01) TaxID=1142394 RepID=I0II85_PHYMF|nr:leucyl/phenylalanyl-tRNA--protein transferase [Phycisphaera mikurensis]MBB6442464.1 leucyl/phenylalanyl-tRNA--protein transferase [Phycisphaera mikurensis]BAM04973.1 leucyl/phenylalanyl-tRNA--protein transferase [Phycisphaera mikurensis NBRC 102666]
MPDPALTPELLLRAYASGVFPMASETSAGAVGFYAADPRAILPLDGGFRVRRSLAKRVRNGGFEVTADADFAAVVDACAAPRRGSPGTWINAAIRDAFVGLHRLGHAHSVEARRGGELVGGLYGLALGGAFFGESMFSRCPDASQVCLVRLVERLRAGGFVLLDSQYHNPHLMQFGMQEIPAAEYQRRLSAALEVDGRW